MPAHIKSMLNGVCLQIPVTGGELALGTWQAIYVAEHRARKHRREVMLQFLGCCAPSNSNRIAIAERTGGADMRLGQSRLIAVVILLSLAASGARAKTIEVNDPHGGLLMWYQWMWSKLAAEKVSVRIVGQCVSACTVLLGYIPRENICVTRSASLGFHLATMQFATDDLWKAYPADIRGWITQHGGLTSNLLWLQVPVLYKFIHKCQPESAAAPAQH